MATTGLKNFLESTIRKSTCLEEILHQFAIYFVSAISHNLTFGNTEKRSQ
jgi:hypothetical protein